MPLEIKITRGEILGGSALLLVIIVAVVVFSGGCNRNKDNSNPPAVVKTETNKSDTSNRPIVNVNVPPTNPVPSSTEIRYVPQPYQQATDVQGLIKQNNELMDKYNEAMSTLTAINKYNEKIALTDSGGKQVGTFQYGDVVSGNKIIQRQPSYWIDQRVITNTKTITIDHPYQPRTQVFAGAELGGNQVNFLSDVAAGLILKTKRDQIIKANITYDLHNNPLFPQRGLGLRFGFYPIISFRKK